MPTYSMRRYILCVILGSQSTGKRKKKPRMAPTAWVFRGVLRTAKSIVDPSGDGIYRPFQYSTFTGVLTLHS